MLLIMIGIIRPCLWYGVENEYEIWVGFLNRGYHCYIIQRNALNWGWLWYQIRFGVSVSDIGWSQLRLRISVSALGWSEIRFGNWVRLCDDLMYGFQNYCCDSPVANLERWWFLLCTSDVKLKVVKNGWWF